MTKLYDLTQPWGAETPPWPYFPRPQIRDHFRWSRDKMNSFIVETSMHVGTHIDAPLHFSSNGWDLASIPLDRLYGTGMVVDLSDCVEEWTIITPEMVEDAAPEQIRENDILILHYGWQKYSYVGEEADEEKYFCRHPGPHKPFVEWMIKKNLKWVGVDCGSMEHSLNTLPPSKIRGGLVKEWEEKTGLKYREVFPEDEFNILHYWTLGNNQMHVENVGGDVAKVVNRRMNIGAFPWRFVRGEASICRVVAFED